MRAKYLALSLLLSACSPMPSDPPPAEVRLWHGDCKDYGALISQPVAMLRPDGLIAISDPSAKIARYQRPECGGSWSVAMLVPTGKQDLSVWLYVPTDLGPPFMIP